MFRSIRTKLTLWYIGVLAVVIIAFASAGYVFTVRILDSDLNARLEEMGRNFELAYDAEQGDEDDDRDTDRAIRESVKELRFRDYQFAVYAGDGRIIASTADVPAGIAPDPTLRFRDVASGDEISRVYSASLDLRGVKYDLVVIHSLRDQSAFVRRLSNALLIGVPMTLLLAGLGGYFLARKSLAPVVEMSRQAAQINAQNLSERLHVKNERDEIGQLAGVFNALLARLDAAFEQQRRFMADASHELRTPLAIVRGESEVALLKGDRSGDDYRKSLAVVHDESKRLTKIVEDLFTLARADAGQFQASFAPVYLDEIVADAVRSIGVLARQKSIEINFSNDAEMPMKADDALLRRLFLNLLDNAVKYNKTGGTVTIKGLTTESEYVISIADSGGGIPADEQHQIFDRFYRVDKARSRAEDTTTSGAGLGLAIAQWIAKIHHGRIELASSDAAGSIFKVHLCR